VLLGYGQVRPKLGDKRSKKMPILVYSSGSAMHAAKTLAHPRWEDFNYEFLSGVKNRLHMLGDGNTVADRDPKADSKLFEAFMTDNGIKFGSQNHGTSSPRISTIPQVCVRSFLRQDDPAIYSHV